MINILFQDNQVSVNDFNGVFESIEFVDDNFVHLTIEGLTIGITPSDTTINGIAYNSAIEFIEVFE
jgi:hypothetical protein